MRKTFFVSFFIFFSVSLWAQSIERKIIIQNGNYFYTTIDENNQLATLHTGKYTDSLKASKKLAMPVGRNFDDPIIPFSWDVVDSNIYAISFLLHPLNDRNEAIKRINISSLKDWASSPTPMELINKSVDMNPFAYNDPYLFVTRRSNILEGFFYDAISTSSGAYTMAISNNGEISIWNYNGTEWKHGEVIKFPVDGYFSLFEKDKKTYLVLNSGVVQEVSTSGISPTKKETGVKPKDGFLIINKDDNSVWFMKNEDLNQRTSLSELVTKKAKRIL